MRNLILTSFTSSLFLSLLLATSSCNKKASSYNPDMVGSWYTVPAYDSTYGTVRRSELIIEKRDGLYNYRCKDTCDEHLCDCVVQQSGRAVINFDKDRLRIGSSSSYSLTIDKEPYQNELGEWVMIIDGLTFYKQP